MRKFAQVDVFTAQPYLGNPLAVVLDARGMSDSEMAQFANWTNLSETTFLLPPTDPVADYRVRIFTPTTEYPFAGHPTIGSCHAWLESGGVPKSDYVIQECGAGLVPLRRSNGRLAFAAPPLIRSGPVSEVELETICAVLRIGRDDIVSAQWADNGPGWVAVLMRSADDVLALEPDFGAAESFDIGVVGAFSNDAIRKIGIAGFADGPVVEVRAIYSENGHVGEDPATGSLNASLAQWLLRDGHLQAPYLARQGTRLGRSGRIHIDEADGEIWVGGDTVTCVMGDVAL
jgi:PhzF family phenazine biosynthesis protein